MSKPPKPNKNVPKSLTYRVFMIVTKMAFISIQTLGQTISNSANVKPSRCKRSAHPLQTLQTLYKLLSNGLETPLKRFQTLYKLLPNPFKSVSNFFQTLCKRFANPSQMPRKRRLAQIAMFNKMCFPMEGHISIRTAERTASKRIRKC